MTFAAGHAATMLPEEEDETLWRSGVRAGGAIARAAAVSGALYDVARLVRGRQAATGRRSLTPLLTAASVIGGRVGWVARNSSKPGRPRGPDVWVVHATPEWSTAYLELDEANAAILLLEAFREEAVLDIGPPVHTDIHRWRYAFADPPRARAGTSGDSPKDAGYLFDASRRIGICGDWLIGARVESAVRSGLALADRLIEERGVLTAPDRRPTLSLEK